MGSTKGLIGFGIMWLNSESLLRHFPRLESIFRSVFFEIRTFVNQALGENVVCLGEGGILSDGPPRQIARLMKSFAPRVHVILIHVIACLQIKVVGLGRTGGSSGQRLLLGAGHL